MSKVSKLSGFELNQVWIDDIVQVYEPSERITIISFLCTIKEQPYKYDNFFFENIKIPQHIIDEGYIEGHAIHIRKNATLCGYIRLTPKGLNYIELWSDFNEL